MDYKLFDEYITLQALLKELGLIHSGGAVKAFLAENDLYFNGELEKRRGKKVRIGDTITIPAKDFNLSILAPSQEEIHQYQEDLAEKKRVADLVKKMNKDFKQEKSNTKQKNKKSAGRRKDKKAPVRFPGM